jgi:hypothetical protein
LKSMNRVVVRLDAKLLDELAKALGSEGCVALHCDTYGAEAIIVTPVNGSVKDAVGVLMPLAAREETNPSESVYQLLTRMIQRFIAVAH